MEIVFWIILISIGVLLYALFGQHRNRFEFMVEAVNFDSNSVTADGIVRTGWIGVSQHFFFEHEKGFSSAQVIGIFSREGPERLAKKGAKVRLIDMGKHVHEISVGAMLTTEKKNPIQSPQPTAVNRRG